MEVRLFHIVVLLIVIGVLLWVVNTYVPMDGKIKQLLNVVVLLFVVLWLLSVFGVFAYIGDVAPPRLHH